MLDPTFKGPVPQGPPVTKSIKRWTSAAPSVSRIDLSTNYPDLTPKPKLLDQVRLALRARHYSVRTEEAYVAWIQGVK